MLKGNFPIDLTENWMLGVNSFPWNIELNGFTCFTVTNGSEQICLPNVNTKLTLDLTKKDKEKGASSEEMSVVIHLDTTPIRLDLDSAQVGFKFYKLFDFKLKRKQLFKLHSFTIDKANLQFA